MSGKGERKRYPVEVKLEAFRQFLEEGKTRAEITKALGLGLPIRNKGLGNALRRWLEHISFEFGFVGSCGAHGRIIHWRTAVRMFLNSTNINAKIYRWFCNKTRAAKRIGLVRVLPRKD